MAFHEMIKLVKVTKGGNYFQGLGRWSIWVMTIDSKHRTRVVVLCDIIIFNVKGLEIVY